MKVRLATVLLLLFATTAAAGGIEGKCDVRFQVTSTLHDFTGTGRCESFTAMLVRTAAGKAILPSVSVAVPVAEMKTGNDSRDRSMRKMFQSDRYPLIRASALDIDTDRVRESVRRNLEGKGPLEILVDIRGLEKKVQATASNLKEEESRVSFDVEFPVSLKEFSLTAPSVLGVIRVADQVLVKATFALDIPPRP